MTNEEIESLVIGDVILYGKNKIPRIVRQINPPPAKSTKPWWKVYTVNTAIRRCSWTGAADTYHDRYCLRTNCEKAGFRVKLDGADDLLFELERDKGKNAQGEWIMGCCLAKNLPA